MKTLVQICGAFALVAFSSVSAQAEPVVFGPGVKLIKHSQLKLKPKGRRVLENWKSRKSYFGAFAVNSEESVTYWSREFHSLENEREFVLSACQAASKKPTACILYASFLPASIASNSARASSLGQPAGKDIQS